MSSNIKVTTNPVELVTTQSTHKEAPQYTTKNSIRKNPGNTTKNSIFIYFLRASRNETK